MGGKYYPELSLDFSQLIDYVNTFSDDFQKLRFLSQYVRLFAIYAEHEPYKLDENHQATLGNFSNNHWVRASKSTLNSSFTQ